MPLEVGLGAGIPAEQAMVTEEPEIAGLGDRLVGRLGDGVGVRVIGLQAMSASEVGCDVPTDSAQLKGRRAVVDIPAGTPITPELLEPAD